MRGSRIKGNTNEHLLLKGINSRSDAAFGELFDLYYNEFHCYASRLYQDYNFEPSDAVQDSFLYIWERKDLKFNTLTNLKAYIIITIKNRFKDYIAKNERERNYCNSLHYIDESVDSDIFESSLYSMAYDMLKLLPSECAPIIELYLKGWKPNEIAQKLGITLQTVYNRRSDSVKILKGKLSKNSEMYTILSLLGF